MISYLHCSSSKKRSSATRRSSSSPQATVTHHLLALHDDDDSLIIPAQHPGDNVGKAAGKDPCNPVQDLPFCHKLVMMLISMKFLEFLHCTAKNNYGIDSAMLPCICILLDFRGPVGVSQNGGRGVF
jgi:hypothetical protein